VDSAAKIISYKKFFVAKQVAAARKYFLAAARRGRKMAVIGLKKCISKI
jgi:hypothetical protein